MQLSIVAHLCSGRRWWSPGKLPALLDMSLVLMSLSNPENRPHRQGKTRLTPQKSPGQRSFTYEATVPEPKHPTSNCYVFVHSWKYLEILGPKRSNHRMVPFSILWSGAAVVEDKYSTSNTDGPNLNLPLLRQRLPSRISGTCLPGFSVTAPPPQLPHTQTHAHTHAQWIRRPSLCSFFSQLKRRKHLWYRKAVLFWC